MFAIHDVGRIGSVVGQQPRLVDMPDGTAMFGPDHAGFHKLMSEEGDQACMCFDDGAGLLDTGRP